MKLHFQYHRIYGCIEIDGQNNIHLDIKDKDLKDKIQKMLDQGVELIVPFKHSGIPGVIKTHKKVEDKQTLKIAFTGIVKELGLFPLDGDYSVIDSPWFVAEDVATGVQAFYRMGFLIKDTLWHCTSITDTPLGRSWTDCTIEGEKFYVDDIEDLSF